MKARLLITLLTAACLISVPVLAATPNTLDGKSYTGATVMDGKKKGDPDSFEFKDGKFHSLNWDKQGYRAAEYASSLDGKKTRFNASTTNKDGNKLVWNGVLKGKKIHGTAQVTDKAGKTSNFTFNGVLKN
ncbi:MAG: hypothetical protein K1X83_03055 [Oligoflexia bacterium]|nr:hypothetical protein [Oligoflexia bacterium]